MDTVLQLQMDQIDPSLMDDDHILHSSTLPATVSSDYTDAHPTDSRHFGRLLDAIHIGSNDILHTAHNDQWQHSDRSKQVTHPFHLLIPRSNSLLEST